MRQRVRVTVAPRARSNCVAPLARIFPPLAKEERRTKVVGWISFGYAEGACPKVFMNASHLAVGSSILSASLR